MKYPEEVKAYNKRHGIEVKDEANGVGRRE